MVTCKWDFKTFPSCKKADLIIARAGLFLSIVSLECEGWCPQKSNGNKNVARNKTWEHRLRCWALRCSDPAHTYVRMCSPMRVPSGAHRSKSCVCNHTASFGGSGSKAPPQPFVGREAATQSEHHCKHSWISPNGSQSIKRVKMWNILMHKAKRAWSRSLKIWAFPHQSLLPPFLKPNLEFGAPWKHHRVIGDVFGRGRGANGLECLEVAARLLFLFYRRLIWRENNLVILCAVSNREVFQFSRLSWAVQQIPPPVLGRSSTVLLEKISAEFGFEIPGVVALTSSCWLPAFKMLFRKVFDNPKYSTL